MSLALEVRLYDRPVALLDPSRRARSLLDGASPSPDFPRLSAAFADGCSSETLDRWLDGLLPENGHRTVFTRRLRTFAADEPRLLHSDGLLPLLLANTHVEYPGAVSFRAHGLSRPPPDYASKGYERIDDEEVSRRLFAAAWHADTKVPHLTIVSSILHYTEPGASALDAFAGSGMTGVAAGWCGMAPDSYRKALEARWAKEGFGKPTWGLRRTIRNDLSPLAGFIAANYALPFDVDAFAEAGRALLDEYRQSETRRLRLFRLEAVRAGFFRAWQGRDYATIIAVAEKIPESILQEDQKLMLWYDQARTCGGEDA